MKSSVAEKREKLFEIRTARNIYSTLPTQYWIKSERGGSYELWEEPEPEMPYRIRTILSKRVLWCIPKTI